MRGCVDDKCGYCAGFRGKQQAACNCQRHRARHFNDDDTYGLCAQAFFGRPIQVVAGLCVHVDQAARIQRQRDESRRIKAVVAACGCAPQYVTDVVGAGVVGGGVVLSAALCAACQKNGERQCR